MVFDAFTENKEERTATSGLQVLLQASPEYMRLILGQMSRKQRDNLEGLQRSILSYICKRSYITPEEEFELSIAIECPQEADGGELLDVNESINVEMEKMKYQE